MTEDEVVTKEQAQPAKKRKGCLGCLMWAGIIVGILALLLCVFVGWTWAGAKKARAELAAKYPPPGQMVDVGGYRLHINCQGSKPSAGSPTVVLESGAGEYSLTWDQVQREVARFARVCAYDRAGLGWSERGSNPRTAPYVAEELEALLTGAGEEPPYVLVGHSMGGLYARYYAYEHPEKVAGMVLEDGQNEEQNQRLPEALTKANEQATQMLRVPQLLSSIGLLARYPTSYPSLFLIPLAPGTKETYLALQAMNPQFFATAIEETAAEEESCAAMRSVQDHSLGDMPLIVVSASEFADAAVLNLSAEERAQAMAVWAELQAELVALSSSGKQVIAEGAEHFIHLDRPELVIDAIREVVEAVQR
jgi:pimeloyl-ACP methyl ester carboxylesterase